MKISQREARRLKAQVQKLQNEREALYKHWRGEYPSWAVIGRVSSDPMRANAVRVVRLMGHPVIAVEQGDDIVLFGVGGVK